MIQRLQFEGNHNAKHNKMYKVVMEHLQTLEQYDLGIDDENEVDDENEEIHMRRCRMNRNKRCQNSFVCFSN